MLTADFNISFLNLLFEPGSRRNREGYNVSLLPAERRGQTKCTQQLKHHWLRNLKTQSGAKKMDLRNNAELLTTFMHSYNVNHIREQNLCIKLRQKYPKPFNSWPKDRFVRGVKHAKKKKKALLEMLYLSGVSCTAKEEKCLSLQGCITEKTRMISVSISAICTAWDNNDFRENCFSML